MTRLAVGCFVGFACLSTAFAEDLNPEKVREAIRWGAETLKGHQNKRDGSWPYYVSGGDPTALCTLALLTSGEVKASDPAIQKALNYLRNKKALSNTYEVALEIMAFCAADPQWDDRTRPNPDLAQIHKRAAWLVKLQNKTGDHSGMWSYPSRGSGDNSNSQFALLGLYEADRTLKRHGQKSPVPEEVWKLALDRWLAEQNTDGSWGYIKKGQGSGYGSMTCAGIASIIIAAGRLNRGAATHEGGQVKCCGNPADDPAAIAVRDGLAWLGKNFKVESHPGAPRRGNGYHFYYMYALERVGRLTAQRFIGERDKPHDWYREGAKFLVNAQNKFRGWTGEGHGEDREDIATSYALLFLSKGNQPTLWAKLKYGQDQDWNNHPLDTTSMTQFVEQEWKRDLLSWHVIEASRATADDYMQAPVLYFNGRKGMEFLKDDEQRARIAKELREYINRGGFIYAEACCDDSGEFHDDFQKLMGNVFEPDFKLDLLPEGHEIWYFEKPLQTTLPYRGWLWEVRKGCRTVVVYCVNPKISGAAAPANPDLAAPSCYWELKAGAGRETDKFPDVVQKNIDAAFGLGINILAYATGRKLKNKLEIPEKVGAAQNMTLDRVILDIRQLRHDGGWNAAPGALVKLQRELNSYAGIQVPTDRREIDVLDPSLFDHHLLFMHGRNGFSFTEKQREQLRKYVENGGMIFGDAVCASQAFADSFRKEMQEIFRSRTMGSIPEDHKLWTTAFGGFDLKQKVTLRLPPRNKQEGRPLKAEELTTSPQLEGITFDNGRYGVIFSKYDLSCALEGHENFTCPGYTRDDAAKIGMNVVLYSLHE
jgi:hypothetical protein